MNRLNWTIEHQCPQCGAPVTLEETDLLLTCAFCRTRLLIRASDCYRYYIPPPGEWDADTVFIPYWRIRGLAYAFEPLNMTSRYVDTNLCAVDLPGLPKSLGLRPQAMKVKFAVPETPGTFLRPVRSVQDVMPDADRTKLGISHHELFIGETVSLIYTPLARKDGMLADPFLQKPLAAWHPEDCAKYPAEEGGHSLRFISTICPQCGWDLQGERDALILTCRNCNTVWVGNHDALQQVPFAVMNGSAGPLIHLPFWRIKPQIRGMKAATVADLVRLANLPKVITDAMENTPLYFWSPAFKVNPALFLRWSRQMTVFQPQDCPEQPLPATTLYPVTLPAGEAIENMLVILGSIVTDKRTFFKNLGDIRIAAEQSLLVYQPFKMGDRELTHETMGVVIEKNALKYSTTL